MASCCCKISSIVPLFVFFLLVSSPIHTARETDDPHAKNQTLRPQEELQKLKISPDGDVIDCVLLRHQPAFDHTQLKGRKPLVPPERPNGHNPKRMMMAAEDFQLWRRSGETCPEGTIPIRRTTEQDMLRASSVASFGKKSAKLVRRDTTNDGHEVGATELVVYFSLLREEVGYVSGDEYYGAKASINVWAPNVTNQYEFSLSQLWVISGSFGDDLNTIEAGWQVSPELYGDYYPRFFTYWTSDAYQATGCYNLLCSGFVQTNNKVAIGAAISPTSSYGGGQFDISLLVWKDPKHGNWWLEFGSGILVGYWPSFLFTHLRDHASMVQFGGEVVNSSPGGSHTSTEMGSGHFASEGFGKASYFRNLQVVDWDNNLIPLPNLKVLADHPGCYDIQGGINAVWGNYFYYGGPGRNVKCP
ncbi:polygalacturonase [Hibiscus syriacus]|uniref:Polygalacturonase n=1 Tax=Hibiscus syriacus TaxID=106335 RepID=A0A6A3A733_HIBSY|nr:polygalacturonase [Hibiscus syriacus]